MILYNENEITATELAVYQEVVSSRKKSVQI
jgi:hypothetical protein